MGEVMLCGCLGHSVHVRFTIFGDRRKTATKTSTLDMGRADFRLLRVLVKVPWETAFEGIGVHQCWSVFKHCLLKAQDQAIPKYQKSSRWGRKPTWLTRDLLLELGQKKKVYGCWKQGQATWKEYRDTVCICSCLFVCYFTPSTFSHLFIKNNI